VGHAENDLVRRFISLVLVLLVVGCGEPSAVSPESTTSVTSTPLGTGRSSTGTTTTLTTSTSSAADIDFPVIELIDPDPTVRGLDVPAFDVDTFLHLRPPVFDLSTIAGAHSHRVEAVVDLGEGGSVRTWSETAGLATRVRVEIAPFDERNPAEWIITPGGVWALVADEWVFYDPNDGESAFIVALAPWQLSSPLSVYSRVYAVFRHLEPQGWQSFDGRDVVVYTGDTDVVAQYWDEQPGDVVSGHIEVWMDPAGFPVKVTTEASEILDLSIPPRSEWLLRDLGAAIELDLPEQVAAAGYPTIFHLSPDGVPVLGVVYIRSCPAANQTGADCSMSVLVYEDGRWKTDGTEQDPNSSNMAPSVVEPLLQALETADFVELRTLLFKGECPTATGGQETVLVFPTVTGPETFASCTLILDPEQSPYREAFKLISELPLD